MASRGLSVEEIQSRCEKVQVTYVSHYVDKETKTTFIIAKCQCGKEIKISIKNLGAKAKQGKTCSCKECGVKKVNIDVIEKTKYKFLQLLNENGHQLLSDYTTTSDKVLIDFKCGHEPHWITPACYMSGQRCPKCYRERQKDITTQQMANMTEEEKEQWKQKIKNTFDNKTEEEKEIMSKNISKGLSNMTEQAKQQWKYKLSIKAKHQHANMSEEEKQIWKHKRSIAVRGCLNPRWKMQLTEQDRVHSRRMEAYSCWRKNVKENANYVCDCCNYKGSKRDGVMHAHHLNDYHSHKELATDIANGVCLCEQCHKEFHSYMGGTDKECTEQDYLEFKQMKQKQLIDELDSTTNVA